MGIYLNPGNKAFQESVNSKIYVDKTGLLEFTNSVIETEDKYICVSRPRRFGKSMAVKMLAAYYDRTCDSHALFDGLKVSGTEEYEKRMNHSDVICLDISWFRVNAGNAEMVVPMLQDAVIRELRESYPGCIGREEKSLPVALAEVNERTGARFVIIIDEWDCLFREDKMDKKSQESYIELLRGLFKDGPAQRFISLGYLAYTPEDSEVFIPNQEVADEFENAIEDGGWAEIAATLRNSEELLRATLEGNAEIVAERLE